MIFGYADEPTTETAAAENGVKMNVINKHSPFHGRTITVSLKEFASDSFWIRGTIDGQPVTIARSSVG